MISHISQALASAARHLKPNGINAFGLGCLEQEEVNRTTECEERESEINYEATRPWAVLLPSGAEVRFHDRSVRDGCDLLCLSRHTIGRLLRSETNESREGYRAYYLDECARCGYFVGGTGHGS